MRFSAREDSPAWCSGLEHAFDYFGGVPRTVLFDNAKTVITERDVFGPGLHRWNPELLRLADRYGFAPRVCRPYRARTKGKVERFNGYLKGSFIVPLAASLRASGLLLDVATANGRIGPCRWGSSSQPPARRTTTAQSARPRGTTSQPPARRTTTGSARSRLSATSQPPARRTTPERRRRGWGCASQPPARRTTFTIGGLSRSATSQPPARRTT